MTVPSATPFLGRLPFADFSAKFTDPQRRYPAGLGSSRLPVGLQAIGPYLGDRTTMQFARLLEREWHAFEAPPGY